MKPTKVLTEVQKQFLDLLSDTSLTKKFYLTGGTALTGFYLPYRLSEDLDFFSENEVNIQEVITFLRSVKKYLKYQSIDLNSSFNRNLIFLKFSNQILKTEFTYFPFSPIKKPNRYKNISIDSPLDIAANKLFTIYQKPRSRDFIDLFMLCREKTFTISEIKKQ